MKEEPESPWIDISVPLRDGMAHWPADPPITIRRVKSIDRGDSANLSEISMGAHSATHVDAPCHFIKEGSGVDRISMNIMIGRTRVIEIRDPESIKPEELAKHRVRKHERVLFKTRNSSKAWRKDGFVPDFVFISDAAADFLVDRGVRLVGVDYLSVGSFKPGGSYVHKKLLGGGVWIIEGIDLSGVAPGYYHLICLPLRIKGGDGAPARAVLRRMCR